MNYTLNQWKKLKRCLEYAQVELSNNLAENSMRPIALGRKNWLHVGSVKSGPKVAATTHRSDSSPVSKYRTFQLRLLGFYNFTDNDRSPKGSAAEPPDLGTISTLGCHSGLALNLYSPELTWMLPKMRKVCFDESLQFGIATSFLANNSGSERSWCSRKDNEHIAAIFISALQIDRMSGSDQDARNGQFLPIPLI